MRRRLPPWKNLPAPGVGDPVEGEEKADWWDRAVEAFQDYADYQARTEREIPLFVLDPADT